VTALTPELPLPDVAVLEVEELVVGVVAVRVVVELAPVVVVDGAVVALAPVLVVDGAAAAVLAEVLERWRARAGSWPLTSIRVISSQVATNRARAPATARRRIMFTRAIRACRTVDGARPRPLSAPGTRFGVMALLCRWYWARTEHRRRLSEQGVAQLRSAYERPAGPVWPRSKRQPLK
jgi:hypothetical protein